MLKYKQFLITLWNLYDEKAEWKVRVVGTSALQACTVKLQMHKQKVVRVYGTATAGSL